MNFLKDEEKLIKVQFLLIAEVSLMIKAIFLVAAIMPMLSIIVGGGIVLLVPMLMKLFIYIIKNMFMAMIE